jgi:hypothetical protein
MSLSIAEWLSIYNVDLYRRCTAYWAYQRRSRAGSLVINDDQTGDVIPVSSSDTSQSRRCKAVSRDFVLD